MRRTAAVAVLLVVGLLAPAVSAAPLTRGPERSDNGIYFRYEEQSRSLPEYGSATTIENRFDRVKFTLQVGLAPEEEPDPLVGIVSLRLNGDKPVHYEGSFVIRMRNRAGQRVMNLDLPVDLVLRPRPGKRRANLTKPFDIPAGWYSANAVFRPAS